MHLSMSTPPPPYGAGSEISGDLILFHAEYSLGPGEFEYIRAFDIIGILSGYDGIYTQSQTL